ncbi:hypothetical protein LTR84_006731 [Exophiala bonariae]|uniref:DUF7730 domain-containing protein n=1 Tax=Exophiala bonariae TaxID=1690606 RepID=A0AAV9N364_9EURO|nr:hypothetical protein LTR84_006731 [Exophiala bonariae]
MATIGLLTIPVEVRLAIHRYIFQDVKVSILYDPTFAQAVEGDNEDENKDENGALEPESEVARGDAYYSRHLNRGVGIGSVTAPGFQSNQHVSILLVCRQLYDEAVSVFFQTVTFQLQSLSVEQERFVRHLGALPTAVLSATTMDPSPETETHSPPPSPSLSPVPSLAPITTHPSTTPVPEPIPYHLTYHPTAHIQILTITHSLLPTLPPEKLHNLFPSLTSLTIQNITIPLAHQTLSALTPHLYTLHHSSSLSEEDNGPISVSESQPQPQPQPQSQSQSPGILVLQTLLCSIDEEAQMEAIMAHASYASRTSPASGQTMHTSRPVTKRGKYALELQFVLRCRHVGMLVVPGMFPMANAPHRHPERVVTYSFNAARAGAGTGGLM